MSTLLGEDLENAQQSELRLKKTEAMLQSLRSQRDSLEEKLQRLKEVLAKENLDVWKLEQGGLAKEPIDKK